jgi:hypothetical protein
VADNEGLDTWDVRGWRPLIAHLLSSRLRIFYRAMLVLWVSLLVLSAFASRPMTWFVVMSAIWVLATVAVLIRDRLARRRPGSLG